MTEELTVNENMINIEFPAKESKCMTVGQLKEILNQFPDDNQIIVRNPDLTSGEAALSCVSVDSFWHGAVTFNTNPTKED